MSQTDKQIDWDAVNRRIVAPVIWRERKNVLIHVMALIAAFIVVGFVAFILTYGIDLLRSILGISVSF